MISDILCKMVEDLDRYLNDPRYDSMYRGALRERIIRVRDDAEYIRFVLDTPCPEWHLPEGFVRERIVKERQEAREKAEKEAMAIADSGPSYASGGLFVQRVTQASGSLRQTYQRDRSRTAE